MIAACGMVSKEGGKQLIQWNHGNLWTLRTIERLPFFQRVMKMQVWIKSCPLSFVGRSRYTFHFGIRRGSSIIHTLQYVLFCWLLQWLLHSNQQQTDTSDIFTPAWSQCPYQQRSPVMPQSMTIMFPNSSVCIPLQWALAALVHTHLITSWEQSHICRNSCRISISHEQRIIS